MQDDFKTPAKRTPKTGWNTSLKSSPISHKFSSSKRKIDFAKCVDSPGPIYSLPSTLSPAFKYQPPISKNFTTFGTAKRNSPEHISSSPGPIYRSEKVITSVGKQPIKESLPMYSMPKAKRFQINEREIELTPGPGDYSLETSKYVRKSSPAYSFSGLVNREHQFVSKDLTIRGVDSPGPKYNISENFTKTDRVKTPPAYSFGVKDKKKGLKKLIY